MQILFLFDNSFVYKATDLFSKISFSLELLNSIPLAMVTALFGSLNTS
jgi:hypothetical protein